MGSRSVSLAHNDFRKKLQVTKSYVEKYMEFMA